jgi:enoyl-CoA hydratase
VSDPVVLIDNPAPHVRRVTLNRPEKRNALNHALRGGILKALVEGDADPDVCVQIVRGAGKCFSAGYELGGGNEGQELPYYTAGGDGHWPRHVTSGWMSIWDLAKPVIAQVHGYCLAGGSELATGCDLVYCAEDAKIGYPAVRFGVPDMHFHAWLVGMRMGMEMMLTGDSISGKEAAELGWATRAYPLAALEMPADLVQLNKRLVHRQMEMMGMRTALRVGTELCALGTHQKSMFEFMKRVREGGLTAALSERDQPFGDYRTSEPK